MGRKFCCGGCIKADVLPVYHHLTGDNIIATGIIDIMRVAVPVIIPVKYIALRIAVLYLRFFKLGKMAVYLYRG